MDDESLRDNKNIYKINLHDDENVNTSPELSRDEQKDSYRIKMEG